MTKPGDVCPNCERGTVEKMWYDDPFVYAGTKLVAYVLIWCCDTCLFQFRGQRAEEAREKVVREHLARSA